MVIYPEFHGTTIWSELHTAPARDLNPYLVAPATAEVLNRKVFPFWSGRNVREWCRYQHGDPECQQLDERWVFYFMWKTAALSHTIPDFATVLRRGLADIAREAQAKEEASVKAGSGRAASKTEPAAETAAYYRSMRLTLEGVIEYAGHLADEAERLAAELAESAGHGAVGEDRSPATDRRAELLEIARICRKVPAGPAETFHEAVQAMWIVWVALHMENSNAGLSLGRLDQVLQPYFAADMERARRPPPAPPRPRPAPTPSAASPSGPSNSSAGSSSSATTISPWCRTSATCSSPAPPRTRPSLWAGSTLPGRRPLMT